MDDYHVKQRDDRLRELIWFQLERNDTIIHNECALEIKI